MHFAVLSNQLQETQLGDLGIDHGGNTGAERVTHTEAILDSRKAALQFFNHLSDGSAGNFDVILAVRQIAEQRGYPHLGHESFFAKCQR